MRRRLRHAWIAGALALAASISACAPGPTTSAADAARIRPDRSLDLHGHTLAIHLVSGAGHPHGPLLLYTTGDGGWSSDRTLFDCMMPWGYPMAGFSAADYVSHLGDSDGTIDPSMLAGDYLALVATATDALGLPRDVPVLLVGLSRGSGLEVAAATNPTVRARLAGVLAVALTGEEEYVVEPASPGSSGPGAMFLTYEALPHLDTTKVAVIQSTRDGYLPAADARLRFGADTPTRRFVAIDAADHTFGGKLPELYAEMKHSLDWILGARDR